MWFRTALIVSLLFGVSLCSPRAEAEENDFRAAAQPVSIAPTITNIVQFQQLTIPQLNQSWPVRLEGVVTLVDSDRNLFVLQDVSGAVAVHFKAPELAPGVRVLLESRSATPVLPMFPQFPAHPDGSDWLPSFSAPTNWGSYYLARMRGYVTPPSTGDYLFWIASKGPSELWLSTNGNVAGLQRIAYVGTGRSVSPGQWNKYPTQVSMPVHLEAGTHYLIDAVQSHHGGRDDTLSVAWQGPSFERGIIGGQFLSPYGNSATNGIVREYWNDYVVGAVEPLMSGGIFNGDISVAAPRITILGSSDWPMPIQLNLGASVSTAENYRWAEIEGDVEFVGTEDSALVLNVTSGRGHSRVWIANGAGEAGEFQNARVRVRGVCEIVTDNKACQITGTLHVPSPREILKIEYGADDPASLKIVPISDIHPANPDLAWHRRIRIRGTFTGARTNGVFIQGAASFSAFISKDGERWISIGPGKEISMSGFGLGGLIVTSFSPGSLATAAFDSVSPWKRLNQSVDVLNPTPSGKTIWDGSTATLKGSGVGIGSSFDQFHFSYEPLRGDGEVVVRINSLDKSNPRAVAGLMIRDSLEGSASFANVGLGASGGAVFQFRQKNGERGATLSLPGVTAPCWLKLTQRHVGILARSDGELAFQPGQEADVTGALEWENGKPILLQTRRVVPGSEKRSAISGRSVVGAPGSAEPTLVSIAQLVPEEGEGFKDGAGAIRIRGVVTFNDQALGANYLTVQDQSGGALVRLSRRFSHQPLRMGDLVEFDLRSVNGKWPVPLEPIRMNVIGLAPLPTAAVHPAEYLLARRGEAHWTEFEGVVQETKPDGTAVLMCHDGPVPFWIGGNANPGIYIDALVRVRGVLIRTANNVRTLMSPSRGFIEIVEAAPANPFVIPSLRIAELKRFNRIAAFHRVKICGVVTHRMENALTVQDETGGGRVQTTGDAEAQVGDQIEAVGFPKPDGGAVSLSGALLKRKESCPLPQPARLTSAEVQDGRFDSMLVQVTAQLLEQQSSGDRDMLQLQSGEKIFRATLPKSFDRLRAIPVASVVQVTGVCRIERGGEAQVENGVAEPALAATEILLRSPADVVVLRRPPWWTWEHTAGAIEVLVLILGAAVVWIRLLRRQVLQRTRELETAMAKLERETETSATLAERNRLAGELHDGLEQGLSAVMMQLDGLESKLANNAAEAGRHLALARNMIRFSRTEVRHSLWDWKSSALRNKDLGSALADIAVQMSAGNSARVTVDVSGAPQLLAPATEHHLLRIGQESLNNALKYAQAKAIQIKLEFSNQAVRLCVSDDGRGFVPETVLSGTAGHLGLQSLRSRARKMGGRLTITSAPGSGTTIEVFVPINNTAESLAKH